MSAYIPPGPQVPFDKDRSFGQRPGFISRNSGKITILIIGLIAILTVAVVTSLVLTDDDEDPEYSSEDYRAGQEQFIELIGEDAFAEFKHEHAPLNCSTTEWNENALACSETWLHRIEIAELTGNAIEPGDVQPTDNVSN